jgi:hypothetical protein
VPVLDNPRHEAFAQALAKGNTQVEAYEIAGFKPNDANATRLTGNDRVRARVAELQSRAAAKTVVTLESLLAEAEEVRSKALADGQYAPAISAIKEKGILAGIRVEKRENTNRSANEMSDDELAVIARAGSGDAASAPKHPQKLN